MDGRELPGVEVLGPLRVVGADGADLTPDGALQRRLLAFLVLHRGHVVSADAAVEVLWPAAPPQDPAGALQNHVSRLRRGLPDGLIESVGAGYRLDPAGIALDADLLLEAIGAGTDVDAVLDRWQGPAYPELDEVDDGRAEAARLEELRVRAREARAERRLTAGDTDGLVAELTALTADEPLREQPRALLMSALAATGRHVEALRAYDDFRRLLGDELGTEPSPALAAQHAELLAGAAPSSRPSPSRLPAPVSSLLGRDELVADVTAQAGVHRLLTLVGPGGVGKTRLLVEVGHRLRSAFPDRDVVLCELAAADGASVVDVVAAAAGVDARPGVPVADHLVDVLADTEVVLLFDNCEHVLEPAADLADRLLAHCSQVRIVATSRERLRAPGERVTDVPSLPAGDPDAPAVQLFVERAQAVAPGFEPDAGAYACIDEIVRRLDGLPLAIELAAARLHTHDVEEVAAGLDHRFSLLDAGHRTTPRHESLWAAASWSYELLDDHLRQVFTALSVFAGPFAVADASAVLDVGEGAVDAALAQLVERSLVRRAPGRRFVLLETLRAFGAEQLTAEGRADAVAESHARHQIDWMERAEARMLQPGSGVLLEIDDVLPELRSALNWFLAHDDVEAAGHLIALLEDYGVMRLRPDVMAWAERVTAVDPEDRSPWASQVWGVSSYAAWMAGDVPEAGVRSDRARQIAERTGALWGAVAVVIGNTALFEGRLDEAAAWYRQGVEAAGDDVGRRLFAAATELLALGYASDPAAARRSDELLTAVGDDPTPYAAYAWYCAGEADLSVDPERAATRLGRALELAELTQASFVTGVAGASFASLAARTGDPAVAAEHYRQVLTDWRRAGMRSTQWTVLRSVAGLLDRLGRHRDAAVLEGAVRATTEGHRIFGADAVTLDELAARLRAELGDEAYEAAQAEGAALDADATVDHALAALTSGAAP